MKNDDPMYERYDKMIQAPPAMEEMKDQSAVRFVDPSILSNDPNVVFSPSGMQLANQAMMGNNANPQLNPINNNPNEEIVYVPTPVDQEYFNKLKQGKENVFINQGFNANPNFLQLQAKNKNDTTSIPQQSFESVVNSKGDDMQKMQDLISLQQKDYQKYFDQLNKMEYQKVYQSLNKNVEDKIYQDMVNSDNQINFNSIASENIKDAKPIKEINTRANINGKDLIIDLPQNGKDLQEKYMQIMANVNNLNNSQQNNNKIKTPETNTNAKQKNLFPRFKNKNNDLVEEIKNKLKELNISEGDITDRQNLVEIAKQLKPLLFHSKNKSNYKSVK